MVFFVLFVFSVWGTCPCYLQHFGAKMRNVDGICNILEYLDLGSHVGRKFAASWSQHLNNTMCIMFTVIQNSQFAWYLQHFGATICNLHGICHVLKHETCSHCYLIVFYLVDTTIAAAYRQFQGFWGWCNGWFKIYLGLA